MSSGCMAKTIPWPLPCSYRITPELGLFLNSSSSGANSKTVYFDDAVADGVYNYCPAYNTADHVTVQPYYCPIRIRKYGLQYVYCCGNDTDRYCCTDAYKYICYEEYQFTYWELFFSQYWPMLLMVMLVIGFGLVAYLTKTPRRMASLKTGPIY